MTLNLYNTMSKPRDFLAQRALWLVVVLACVLIELFDLKNILQFDRILIDDGQWWLLFTSNYAHLNFNHFLINVAGVIVLAVFFADWLPPRRWAVAFLLLSISVTTCIYLLNPEVSHYVGLSGVLHGLFFIGASSEIKMYPLSGWLIIFGLIAKITWEQVDGPLAGSESLINGSILVDAHLYGIVAGAILVLVYKQEDIIAYINARKVP